MKLNVQERLALLNTLPKEGDFTTLKIVRELRENLSFSEQEHKGHEIVVNNETGRVRWNTNGQTKDVPFGAKAKVIVVDALTKLDGKKALTELHLSVYEKFVATAADQETEDT